MPGELGRRPAGGGEPGQNSDKTLPCDAMWSNIVLRAKMASGVDRELRSSHDSRDKSGCRTSQARLLLLVCSTISIWPVSTLSYNRKEFASLIE